MPPPAVLRPYLSFRRLTGPALDAARRALDDDAFRERVRVAADASGIVDDAPDERSEQAILLLLERPEGWEAALADVLADAGAAAAEADARSRVDALERDLARAREERDAAERSAGRAGEGRQRAEADLEALRRATTELSAELEGARAEAGRLVEERRQAVRDLKAVETRLAERTAELRTVREELAAARSRLAELEVARSPSSPFAHGQDADAAGPARASVEGAGAERADAEAGRPESAAAADTFAAAPPLVDPFPERAAVGEAVARAADAAGALTRALADAAALLTPGSGSPADADDTEDVARPRPATAGSAATGAGDGRTGAGGRRRRVPPRLPVGMFDDTVAAAEHLVRLPGAVVLVDGYNVALGRWSGLRLPDQRERLVGGLDVLAATAGCEVVVVFDGAAEGAGRPAGSRLRGVQVRFTPDDVEADDEILALVGRYPVDRPVVVVSSDRRVAEGARAAGAATVSSGQLADLLDDLLR